MSLLQITGLNSARPVPLYREIAEGVPIIGRLDDQHITQLDLRTEQLAINLRQDTSRTFAGCIAYVEEIEEDKEHEIDWIVTNLLEDHLDTPLHRVDLDPMYRLEGADKQEIWEANDNESGRHIKTIKKSGVILFDDTSSIDAIVYCLYGGRTK